MITRSDFSPSKSRRLVSLENSWNVALQIPNQPRRHKQMTKDIKKFILQSIDGDVHQAERQSVARSKKTDGLDIFGKISSTFNFTHHEGTDAKTELKVVKIILIREGQIMTLTHLSNKVRSSENVPGSCTGILEVLAEIRESTLNYLEALCLWRQTIPNGNTMSPRIFFWERKNYTLKIVNDLDFLADNALIIQALNITPEQFRSNPLMLTNNLDDPNTWMDPVERAGQDAGGVTQGTVFESRLRLRFAERILLQEIELTTNPSVEDSGFFLTEPQSQQPQGYGQYAAKYQPHYQQQGLGQGPAAGSGNQNAAPKAQSKQLVKGSSVLEADFDDDSYIREAEEGLQNGLMDKSTWGLPGSFEDPGLSEKLNRILSGDSDSAVRPSLPNSRSSSINNGMSAPNSSQSNRGNINSLRAGHTGPPTATGTASGTVTGTTTARSTASGRGFEYGHDFFSGHWAESKPFIGNYDSSLEGGSSTRNAGDDIFFVDEGQDVSPFGNLQPKRKSKLDSIDDASVGSQKSNVSIKSIDSVASMEVHVIANIRHPPKNLVLAATACVILLTPGNEIPKDVSWAAFIKMCNAIDVSALLRTLDPVKIHKFKVLAIQPMLEQMLDEMTYDGLANNSLPYHEYSAVNKLVSWVQQFTSMSINKQTARRPHPILAPSPATAARKTRELAATNATASTNNTATVTAESLTVSGPDIGTLPVKKRVIPSASLQLVPFYSEVDSTLYKTPLLIALLGSFEKKSSFLSQRKPRPPRSGKFAEEEVDDLDRLVVKVYDVLGTAEYHHTVIIREYVIFLSELEEDYHNLAHKYFQPEDREWWAAHIKEVLVVQPKPQNKLKLFVSRKAIEQIVADGVASGVDPKPLIKMTTSPTPMVTLTTDASASKKNDSAIKEGDSKKNKEPKTKPAAVGAPSDRLTAPKTSAALGSVKVPPNLSSKANQPSKDSATSSKAKGPKAEAFPATAAPLAPVVTDKKPREGSAPSKKVASAANATAPVPTPARAASPAAAAPAKAVASNSSTKDNKESAPKKATAADRKPVAASAKVKPVAPAAKATVVPGAKSMQAVIPSPNGSTASTAPFAAPTAAVADLEKTVEVMNISPTEVQSVPANREEAGAVGNSGGGDADYNEDFEADSVAGGNPAVNVAVTTEDLPFTENNVSAPEMPPAVASGVSARGTTGAADYDEDFEEEASLENGTNVDDANTTDAVLSNADTYSYSNQDATKSAAETGNNKDPDARYYSDFEENSVGAASGLIIDDQSSYNNVGEEIVGGDRPLSMIEAAQREFDEIGEDDGVFFNSVDDEDF